jgi:hypothetical protein
MVDDGKKKMKVLEIDGTNIVTSIYILFLFGDKYKNYIMEGLTRKVEMYEKELKPQPKAPEKGLIYVLKMNNVNDDIYRIGKSTNFKKSSEKQTKTKKKTIKRNDIKLN